MEKTVLNGIANILPFDENYIKVEKDGKWNLVDSTGKFISENWFTSITKNQDGSIVTEIRMGRGRTKPTTVKFISTDSFANTVKMMDVVPVKCIDLLDSGSIEVFKDEKYVAKALLYGKTVYVKKEGDIYNPDGEKLRILFSTVDSERLYKAIGNFNRKMHYDFQPLVDKSGEFNSTYEGLQETNTSMWAFYWVTDDTWCVKTDFNKLAIGTNVKKWTDDLILRVFTNLPGDALTKLKHHFGEGEENAKCKGKFENISWHFKKDDLDRIIEVLNSF